ncbi:MAG TPA: anti-sigma factor, partial [Ktedonobacterales bacterium]|nr:anti-sigma factor [Ktedonobacterales bacterium]
DLINAYALGALEPDEAAQVERHLEWCELCRAEARDAFRVTDDLLILLAQPTIEAPDPSLRERTLARVRSAAADDARLQSLAPQIAQIGRADASAQRTAENPFQRFLRDVLGTPDTLSITQETDAVLHDLLADPDLTIWPVSGTNDAPHASGRLIGSRSRAQAALVTTRLHPLAMGQEYQVWFLKEGKPQPNILFTVNRAGQSLSVVLASAPLRDFDTVAVTPEPAGGSPDPTGPIVLAGRLEAAGS